MKNKIKVAIGDKFFDSFAALPRQIQVKVTEFINKFKNNPRSSSINLEKVQNAQDDKIYSARINDTYRTIKNLPNKETLIDIGKINDKYFINVACTGIDAEVANNIDKLRNTIIPTSQLYNASIVYTFIKFKHKKMKLKTSVKNIETQYTILSICNGAYYGGGFNIAPKSTLTDGLLDVYYAEKMSKIKMIPLILRLKKGKHEGKRRIHKFRTNHVELELDEKITFNVDGEKLTGNKFIIDVLPKSITLFNDNDFVERILK